MKKLIALALLVACSTTSLAWADGPDHRDDHQQWQNGPQGGHESRGPSRIMIVGMTVGTIKAAAQTAIIKCRSVTISRPAVMNSARGTRFPPISVATGIGLVTGTIGVYHDHRKDNTGPILMETTF